jgi:hypothetical protein
MIVYMIDTQGRMRIGRLVGAEMARRGITGHQLAASGRPRIATINRIKAGDPNVSETMLRALGDKLGLPRDFLIYVGTGDTRKISSSARPDHDDDPDLIRWTLDLIQADNPGRERGRRTAQ